MDFKLVVIRRFPAMIHAELAKGALEAYEIDAAINGDPQPGWSEHGLFELLVREQDVAVALEILGPPERFSDD